ncbi:MAG TPA: head protein [Lachnospiraceae bacterium]|nr:head protein [Lachnospiraceae bacterium]
MVISTQNLSLIFRGYSATFNKSFEEAEANYPKVAMVIPSVTRENTYGWMGQMPNMREWIGEREIANLSAYDYEIKNRDFELTIQVPVDDIADDQYGMYGPVVAEMGSSAKKHPDSLVFSLMGDGFTKKCYDGASFFSDKHPLDRNGKKTQSNMGNKKLSAKSYAEARVQMMTILGEHGRPLNIVPDLLVVSPQNEAVARELLFADLIAGSSNVNKNTCVLLVVPELSGYAEQWYLLCTKRNIRPFVFQEREKPKLICKNNENDDNVFFRNEVIYGIKARYNAGFGMWQLAYGSTGTAEG